MNKLDILGIILVALKLTGVISLSWFWVLLPFFAYPAIYYGAICVADIYARIKYP